MKSKLLHKDFWKGGAEKSEDMPVKLRCNYPRNPNNAGNKTEQEVSDMDPKGKVEDYQQSTEVIKRRDVPQSTSVLTKVVKSLSPHKESL